jgi:flagellar export protein FliJ
LNHVRGSRGRANLDTLEAGLDGVKAQWYRLYRDVQEAERKEKAQIAQLLAAERELKSIEKLLNRYEAEHKQQLGKAEQAMLDDVALRRFLANTRGERP